jgi:hypothetical protein
VAGRTTAPHVVVVHAWEVIVNERIRVDALDRARHRHRSRSRSTTGLGCCEAQNRPQPFAARKKAVAHRLVDGRGLCRRLRQKAVERFVHKRGACREVFVQSRSHERVFRARTFSIANLKPRNFTTKNTKRTKEIWINHKDTRNSSRTLVSLCPVVLEIVSFFVRVVFFVVNSFR